MVEYGMVLMHINLAYIETYAFVEVCKVSSYQMDDRNKTNRTKVCQRSNIYRPPRPNKPFLSHFPHRTNKLALLGRDHRQEVPA